METGTWVGLFNLVHKIFNFFFAIILYKLDHSKQSMTVWDALVGEEERVTSSYLMGIFI